MNREQEVKQLIKKTVIGFKPRLKKHNVFFFGSRVSGQKRQRSDFDVGIEGSAPLPVETLSDLRDALDDLPTLYRIDLVDFARTAPTFLQEARLHLEKIL